MIRKRPQDQRGPTDLGWLTSMHSFSFGRYHDPKHMGFSVLRVINEDRVAAGAGFDPHPHKNMEIISYVLKGSLSHKDSIGNGSIIRAGDIQLMSAGSGVTHSEYNASDKEEAHFLQIWVLPHTQNAAPSYQQKSIQVEDTRNKFHVVVSLNGENDSLIIRQDARMLIGKFDASQRNITPLNASRKYWIQMICGDADVNGEKIAAGDGLAIENESSITVLSITDVEMLLFDLPQ